MKEGSLMMAKFKEGYIKVGRQLQHHWLWEDKPFSKGQAWIDLILMANYETKKFVYKNEVIEGQRGSVYRSITYLANRWGWSRKKTKCFLSQLENDKMVTTKVTTHGTTISIVKYSDFQDKGTTKEPQSEQVGNSQGTAKEHIQYIINKDKGIIEEVLEEPPWEPEGGWDG